MPKAYVLRHVNGSFDAYRVVVRLVKDELFQLYALVVFFDAVFTTVYDVKRVYSIFRVPGSHRHRMSAHYDARLATCCSSVTYFFTQLTVGFGIVIEQLPIN